MVPAEPVSSCSSPKPHSDTKHILHHNSQLPNPVFWLSGNKLEFRPRDLESHNCTIFLQHQTLQLTKVKFVEEEKSLPKCVSFTINMVQNSALCEITAIVPGKKIRACFGFCDIHNFTNATECLQEDVMMFVNKITDVVHSKVVLNQGFLNKNIGDAFLIVEEDCSRQLPTRYRTCP